jgi:TatD DNase family protein
MFLNAHTHHAKDEFLEVYNLTLGEEIHTWFSVGIHPWHSANALNSIHLIENLIQLKGCLAIGETGLDSLRGPELKDQIIVFHKHIVLSEKYQLPMMIHCVRCWNELKSIRRIVKPKQEWVFHGASKASLLEDIILEGLTLSIGADIIKNEALQLKLKSVPLDKILVETDDSNISIEVIYAKIAKIFEISNETLQLQIEQNFKRIFTKWNNG